MKNTLNKRIGYGLMAMFLALPSWVAAQGVISNFRGPAGLPNTRGGNFQETLLVYINIALGFTGIIAVAFIIYGGFRYITSAGNEEVAESGKKTLTNAIIGLIIVIFSYTIVTVIINTLAR